MPPSVTGGVGSIADADKVLAEAKLRHARVLDEMTTRMQRGRDDASSMSPQTVNEYFKQFSREDLAIRDFFGPHARAFEAWKNDSLAQGGRIQKSDVQIERFNAAQAAMANVEEAERAEAAKRAEEASKRTAESFENLQKGAILLAGAFRTVDSVLRDLADRQSGSAKDLSTSRVELGGALASMGFSGSESDAFIRRAEQGIGNMPLSEIVQLARTTAATGRGAPKSITRQNFLRTMELRAQERIGPQQALENAGDKFAFVANDIEVGLGAESPGRLSVEASNFLGGLAQSSTQRDAEILGKGRRKAGVLQDLENAAKTDPTGAASALFGFTGLAVEFATDPESVTSAAVPGMTGVYQLYKWQTSLLQRIAGNTSKPPPSTNEGR